MSKLIDKLWKLIVLIGLQAIVAILVGLLAIEFLPSPTGEAVYNAMLILFVFGAGTTVIGYGNVKKNSNFYLLGFGFFLLALFITMDKYEGFAVKIGAFATLILAFAAFLSIYVSITEGRRVRQDNVDRESSGRKERLIDEVTKWLRELEASSLGGYSEIRLDVEDFVRKITSSPKIAQKEWEAWHSKDQALVAVGKVNGGIKEAEYYQKLTLKINGELSRLIGVIANIMEQRTEMLYEGMQYPIDLSRAREKSELVDEPIEQDSQPVEGSGLGGRDSINKRLGRNANDIRESIRNALDKVIEVKTSFIEGA